MREFLFCTGLMIIVAILAVVPTAIVMWIVSLAFGVAGGVIAGFIWMWMLLGFLASRDGAPF